jgi:glycerol-3-phosphate dehydrogenase (NAD(P)+)
VSKVAVMGAGSWGTTFAMMCCDVGETTTLWARRPDVADEVRQRHTNVSYLPGIDLPPTLDATADPEQALRDADVVVLGVPSVGIGEQLGTWGHLIGREATLVSLIKGVDVSTLRFGSQVISDTLDCEPDRVVVVSGPNLARECAQRQPSATVAASPDADRAERVQAAVMAPYFRVYTNPDKVGCEVGGAVKNVIALAAGMADGMEMGHNAKATLVTRGLAEMTRLGVALGGRPLTYLGLAGVGDLVVTCTSPDSRNRTVGERLGRGERLDDVLAGMNMVAEGVKSSRAIVALAEGAGVEMPISAGVAAVLHDGQAPLDVMKVLMSREAKAEMEGLPHS